jgi:thymidylate synthase
VAYYHTISDAHIYADQLDHVRLMLSREERRLPSVRLSAEGQQITDIHEFRAEHFEIADYAPHPYIGGIPVSP